jgi:hypothetical protein
LETLEVEVTSSVSAENYTHSKRRVLNAVESLEAGVDMVTEGYTGINKIKFITRASEGKQTIRCEPFDEKCEIKLGFTLRTETESTRTDFAQKRI